VLILFLIRVAELLLAMHLHGTAALENASALTAVSPTTSTTGSGVLSPTTTTATTTRFPASVSTTNLAGISPGGQIHQRRQSSPTDSTVPNAFSPPPPPVPALPFPSILTATPRTLSRLRALLSSWHFEPYLLSPPETLLCVQLVFEALLGGLKLSSSTATSPSEGQDPESPPITMADHLVPFLTDLMRLYRRENRYHSFVHALDVLQAVYTFLELQGRVDSVAVAFLDGDGSSERELEYADGRWRSHSNPYAYTHGSGHETGARGRGRVSEDEPCPLALLSDDDLFLLCLAAIGHDVGHPGNSNAFLVSFCLFVCFFVGLVSEMCPVRKTQRRRCRNCTNTSLLLRGCIVHCSCGSYGSMEWGT
jgi:3'5'-cyclic nucleotide phosphodiesterase